MKQVHAPQAPSSDVQSLILVEINEHGRNKVVSVNRVMRSVERKCAGMPNRDDLARRIIETSRHLGLIPVYDPKQPRGRRTATRASNRGAA